MSNGREIEVIGQSDNIFYGILNQTFYKSTDNANTWAMVSGFSRFPAASVKEYLFNSDELYIATDNAPQIYKSTDGGEGWTEITANYPWHVNIRNDQAFREALCRRPGRRRSICF